MSVRRLLVMVCAAACALTPQACSDGHPSSSTAPAASLGPSSAASRSPTGTPLKSGWLQTIPDTVRIDRNVHAGRDGSMSKQSRKIHRASLLGICGLEPPDLDIGATDRIGVEAPDYPGDSRTLYLYTDATQAAQRFTLTKEWLAGCDGNQECCTTTLRASSLGDWSLLEVTTDVGTGAGPTGRWLRLIRVGNALLLTDSDDDASPGPSLERDIRRQQDALKPVVSDLRVFAAA
jgi:hypothetical protein